MRRMAVKCAIGAVCIAVCMPLAACSRDSSGASASTKAQCVEVNHVVDLADTTALTRFVDTIVAVDGVEPIDNVVAGSDELGAFTAAPVATFKGSAPAASMRYLYEKWNECGDGGIAPGVRRDESLLVFAKRIPEGARVWKVEALTSGDIESIRRGNVAAYPARVKDVLKNVN